MPDIIYTRIEDGVVIDWVITDENSVELGNGVQSLVKLATLYKNAVARGRVKVVLDSSDFTLKGHNLSETDDAYKGMWLVLLSGNHKFVPRHIGRYKGSSHRVQFIGENRGGAFPNPVEVGDKWIIIDRDSRDTV